METSLRENIFRVSCDSFREFGSDRQSFRLLCSFYKNLLLKVFSSASIKKISFLLKKRFLLPNSLPDVSSMIKECGNNYKHITYSFSLKEKEIFGVGVNILRQQQKKCDEETNTQIIAAVSIRDLKYRFSFPTLFSLSHSLTWETLARPLWSHTLHSDLRNRRNILHLNQKCLLISTVLCCVYWKNFLLNLWWDSDKATTKIKEENYSSWSVI